MGGGVERLKGLGGHSSIQLNLLSVLISKKMPYTRVGIGQS